MLITVLTTVSLLALCYGTAYSQRNKREIPLSYKLHNHPSHSSNHLPEIYQPDYYKEKYRALQYAPLPHNAGDIINSDFRQRPELNHDPHRISTIELQETKKEHLEPQKVLTNNFDRSMYTPFILGHNIEVRKSASHSPGLNTAYRNYPKDSDQKYNKVNILRQYVISRNPNQQTGRTYYPSTEIVETTPTSRATRLYLDKPIHRNGTYSLLSRDTKSIETLQPHLSYANSHRLHLNVARALDGRSKKRKTSAEHGFLNYVISKL